jgi:hypothetical protein
VLPRLFGKRFGTDILDMRIQECLRTATREQFDL